LMNELALATLFNTKSWARRFGISERLVKRLRAEARDQLAQMARKGPVHCQVLVFNSGSSSKQPGPKKAAA